MDELGNRDIRLKDELGNYLYPLSREDDQGRVFKDTYLTKLGEDSYLVEAKVSDVTTESNKLIKKLQLYNRVDMEHPVEFLGGDAGYATWGAIEGNINDQGDLILTMNNAISLGVSTKSKIFKQSWVPTDTSEYTLQAGDLWYVTGAVPGYITGKWYIYEFDGESLGHWVEVTDQQIKENESRINVTESSISTEVTERKAGESTLRSRIDQTATEIKSEVGIQYTRYYEPADEPPVSSSELTLLPGDLWYCSDDSKGYTKNTWYIYYLDEIGEFKWREATQQEYNSVKTAVIQNGEEIIQVAELGEENYAKMTVRVDGVTSEVHHATRIFKQDTEPKYVPVSNPIYVGDLWYNTTGGLEEDQRWHIWKTGSLDPAEGYWELVSGVTDILSIDTRLQITDNTSKIDQADDHINLIVESKQSSYTSATPPQDTKDPTTGEVLIKVLEGELWYCTSDSEPYKAGYWYVCTGHDEAGNTTWQEKEDGRINKIEVDTEGVRLIANSASKTFKQETMPLCREEAQGEKAQVDLRKGDLWFCTNGITTPSYSDTRTSECPIKNPKYDSTKTEEEYKKYMSCITNTWYEYSGSFDSSLNIPIWDYCEDPSIKESKAWIDVTGEKIESTVTDHTGAINKVTQSLDGVMFYNSEEKLWTQIKGGSIKTGTLSTISSDETNQKMKATMDATGLTITDEVGNDKIKLTYQHDDEGTYNYNYPYIQIGVGTKSSSGSYDAGQIKKFGQGLWVGSRGSTDAVGDYPGGGTSPSATGSKTDNGIFIDFSNGKVYNYIAGVPSEIGKTYSAGTGIAISGTTISLSGASEASSGTVPIKGDSGITWGKPVAVFG